MAELVAGGASRGGVRAREGEMVVSACVAEGVMLEGSWLVLGWLGCLEGGGENGTW